MDERRRRTRRKKRRRRFINMLNIRMSRTPNGRFLGVQKGY